MFVVYPPDFDAKKKYPLIQMIHGGPHGMFGDQFHFRWNPHAFAAPGAVVAMVNFHGSTSWGQEFAQCIQGFWGERPLEDIMRATDLLEQEPWIDKARMAAIGGSYGGYMVSWIAGHTDRFACLVNHAGVSDLLGQWGSDVAEGREVSMGGSPWQNLETVDHWNPIRYAAHFKSPMLVLHGERDFRVPYTQGLQIYSVYKGMGLPARLVVFPDENHWILKPRNSRLWFKEVLGWLGKYLKTGV
jgi:dipeptidyl aminopeptidase/acylaminoacyl peptidase